MSLRVLEQGRSLMPCWSILKDPRPQPPAFPTLFYRAVERDFSDSLLGMPLPYAPHPIPLQERITGPQSTVDWINVSSHSFIPTSHCPDLRDRVFLSAWPGAPKHQMSASRLQIHTWTQTLGITQLYHGRQCGLWESNQPTNQPTSQPCILESQTWSEFGLYPLLYCAS